ncbi:RNA polymerase Rpc34 [Ascobolus immersus RN42]|uniref:DNA-directed RNA polymerase III subunit RPC6 n=1 Tax=Ascobolus immersus RN42 TaxID=1160509 RepID=A0A3N4INL2_ASCIM|nr:RNA polymerase Rpc34 [Ascobolus immersus RN42]
MDPALVVSIADTIHDTCSEDPDKYYEIPHLQTMDDRITNLEILRTVINHMLAHKLIKAMQRDEESVFRIVDRELAERLQQLSAEESLLFTHIDSAGTEGIWTKTLKIRTNLHQTTITKSLKSLEAKKFIKCIKSVKHPTRKIYMLYHLTPDIGLTGGPWFTDAQLDDEFISALKDAIERYIYEKSFPRGTTAEHFPPGWQGYASLEGIHRWVADKGLTDVAMELADIKALVDVLIFDRRVERVGVRGYKSIRGTIKLTGRGVLGRPLEERIKNGLTETPCGHCPVKDICEDDGPINARNCIYWADWLKQII